MTLVVQNNGEAVLLNYLVNKDAIENLVLKLFQNNITPAETDTAATYTEGSFTGYAAINLVPGDWTVTAGAPSDATALQKTFTSSTDQAVQDQFGYYLIRITTLDIVWSERFTDGPYPISNNGDNIKVTAKITMD